MSQQAATYVAEESFQRDTDYISDRITRDERDGWPVEPGRYRLVAAKACPWATRSIIVRSLLGLEDVISLGLAAPVHDDRSWTFDLDPGGKDPVLGVHFLRDAYERRHPGYGKGITVPAMVDLPTGAVVTNDFPMITHDLFFEWSDHHRDAAPRRPRRVRTGRRPSTGAAWASRETSHGSRGSAASRCGRRSGRTTRPR